MAQPDSTPTAPCIPTTAAATPVDDLLARLSLNTPDPTSPHPALAPAALPPLPALPVPSAHPPAPTSAPPPPDAPSSSLAATPPSPRPFVLFQPACALHRYARTADIGTIVERPERLRAVKTGVAAAWARLDLEGEARRRGNLKQGGAPAGAGGGAAASEEAREGAEGLDALLESLSLSGGGGAGAPESSLTKGAAPGALKVVGGPFDILSTSATMRVDDPALRLVHPEPNRAPGDDNDDGWSTASSTPPRPPPPADAARPSSPSRPPSTAPLPWPSQLQSLCRASLTALLTAPHHSEIPPHLPQGDLYLCPASEGAIFGALGAACEGVDRAVAGEGEGRRGFVAVRPPGHVRSALSLSLSRARSCSS